MSDFVLEIRNLTRRFGKFMAVDSLTLSVNAGEVFGLLGSNGAGKTTTIKMLTTLLPPSSGDAHVAGFSITTQAVGVRRAIGYVPQAVSMDGSLTGYENLLIFAKLYDLPHREPCGSRRRSRGSAHTSALSSDRRRAWLRRSPCTDRTRSSANDQRPGSSSRATIRSRPCR